MSGLEGSEIWTQDTVVAPRFWRPCCGDGGKVGRVTGHLPSRAAAAHH